MSVGVKGPLKWTRLSGSGSILVLGRWACREMDSPKRGARLPVDCGTLLPINDRVGQPEFLKRFSGGDYLAGKYFGRGQLRLGGSGRRDAPRRTLGRKSGVDGRHFRACFPACCSI